MYSCIPFSLINIKNHNFQTVSIERILLSLALKHTSFEQQTFNARMPTKVYVHLPIKLWISLPRFSFEYQPKCLTSYFLHRSSNLVLKCRSLVRALCLSLDILKPIFSSCLLNLKFCFKKKNNNQKSNDGWLSTIFISFFMKWLLRHWEIL